jgi:uncharacterized protein YegP (UPF0339 family)
MMAKRVLIERADGTWGWHLKADNGAIIATDGSQGYENEADARRMADSILAGDYADADRTIRKRS